MAQVGFQDVMDAQKTLTQTSVAYWHQHVLYTPIWWLLVVLWVIPWIVWLFLFDRAQSGRLVLNGLFVVILSSFMDALGTELSLWDYPRQVFPLLPRALVFDIGLLPVAYMLLCQYFFPWKKFLWAALVMSAVLAFAGEPLTIKLGIYKPIVWKSIYSFPIYFLLSIVVRLLVQKIMDMNATKEPS